MKRGWLALAMLVPLFAGCISDDDSTDRTVVPNDPGYDADELDVSGVKTHDLTIASGDIELAAVLYEPLTEDSINGEDPKWPLVVFVHPWGFPKETYENAPLSSGGSPSGPDGAPSEEDDPRTNLLQRFAEAGIMSIAYDTRGWGESGGESSVAGEAEMRDLRAVIDHVNETFRVNGNVGVTGVSYGGGHAFRAWAEFDDVVTAVPHNGWVDLYEGVFPGNVPKLEWGAALYGTGTAGAGGEGTSTQVTDWMATGVGRQTPEEMDGIQRQLDTRSILHRGVTGTDKPLLLCSAIQDTLFNQNHLAWQHAPGFVRSVYYAGGHNTLDAECWDKTLQWFQFFLAGIDTQVDAWPFLQTVDLSGEGQMVTYSNARAFQVDVEPLYLREEQLVTYDDPSRTFNIQQRVASNPFNEPSLAWETTGQPYQEVPEQFRQDPSGVFFTGAAMEGTATLLGAPQVTLQLADGTEAPFQVVATLYQNQDGNLRILGRGAANPLGEVHLQDGNTTTIDLPWMKVDLQPDDRLVLKLASSDPSMYSPFLSDFDAEFTGESRLDVPFFAPPATSG